jgi:fatty-acyl-CoA synthase
MPLAQRITAQSTYDVLRNAAAAHGPRTAIQFLPEGTAGEQPLSVSYAELFANVQRTANLFYQIGIRPGRSVSYLLPNLPQTHYAIWGGQAAGIVNAINPLLNPPAIAALMRAAESRVLVTLGPTPGSDIWEKAQAVQSLVDIDVLLVVGGEDAPGTRIYDFDRAIARQPADRLTSGRQIVPDEICAYFHTGGTTGAPKLAQHTHRGEVYEAWAISHLTNYSSEDCLLVGLPLFHVNAAFVTGLAAFYAGSSTVILSPSGFRNPKVIVDFWRIIERYRATIFSAVPTIYSTLLNVPIDGADVTSLRFGICGAAPMPIELFRNFEAATGIRILEGYGITEGTCVCSFNPPEGERRVGSIGIRYPYQPLKAVKLDADGAYVRDCAVDEVGLLAVSGPNVFPGYKQESLNKHAFVAPGWLNTGDLARQDSNGYFWLVGRAKDLIIRGGHNVDPVQIEQVLHQHPAVALAAAVGRPDPYAGEVPVAYVQLKPDMQATAEELRAFAGANIFERPAAPVEIFIVDRLPLTAVGKIFKPDLRSDSVRRAFLEALSPLKDRAVIQINADPAHARGMRVSVDIAPYAASDTEALAGEAKRILGVFALQHEIRFF